MRLANIAVRLVYVGASFPFAFAAHESPPPTIELACQACHTTTSPTSSAPHRVGQRQKYLEVRPIPFKGGSRNHDLMNAIAAQLSGAEIDSLAACWANRPVGSDLAIPNTLRNANWNYRLFTADKSPRGELDQAQCLACHEPAVASNYVFTLKRLREREIRS